VRDEGNIDVSFDVPKNGEILEKKESEARE
jgi:hypothetical protein